MSESKVGVVNTETTGSMASAVDNAVPNSSHDRIGQKDTIIQEDDDDIKNDDTSNDGNNKTTVKQNMIDDDGSNDNNADPGKSNSTNNYERPWDNSNRKVVLQGVTKFLNLKHVTKMVDEWIVEINSKNNVNIKYDKIKKPPKTAFAVIQLVSDDMVQPIIDYINSNNVKDKRGKTISAKIATDNNDKTILENNNNKRKHPNDNDNNNNEQRIELTKRQRKEIGSIEVEQARRPTTEDEIKDKVTPLWKLTSEQQLDNKMKEMVKKCALKIINDIKSKFRQLEKEKNRKKKDKLYTWLDTARPINVEPIVAAPTALRNKVEFTFGYKYLFDDEENNNNDSNDINNNNNVDNKDDDAEDSSSSSKIKKIPAIGFMVNGWAGGVSYTENLYHIPSEATDIVNVFNDFLATSTLPPYDAKTHQGFWRVLTVRLSNRTKECMLIIQHSPPSTGGVGDDENVNDFSSDFDKEKDKLISILTTMEFSNQTSEKKMKVTSVFFQSFGGLSNPSPDHPVQHAFGKTYLTEELGKCKFQISPGAFFQVITEGAELLYQLAVDKVKEVSDNPEKTLLFDVCCGTGTIGLTCMKEGAVGEVVGVDISEPAIEDAKKNAILNGFTTDDNTITENYDDNANNNTDDNNNNNSSMTRFVAARAEAVMYREMKKAINKDRAFVAIVDPAREGLHPNVVKAIRSYEQIERIVYISCNPTGSLVNDAALFCMPSSKKYKGRPFKITSAKPVDMFPYTNHCEMVMTFDRMKESEL